MLIDSSLLRLCDITRFSQLHFIERDTDAMHTIRMQLYVLSMYNDLGNIIPYKELCYRILVHDLDEIQSCDIPRNIKYYSKESNELINSITYDLLNKSGIKEEIINDIFTAKSKDEWGLIIKYLDIYDALNTLIKEWKLQNTNRILECIKESFQYLSDTIAGISTSGLPKEVIDYLSEETQDISSRVYSSFLKCYF